MVFASFLPGVGSEEVLVHANVRRVRDIVYPGVHAVFLKRYSDLGFDGFRRWHLSLETIAKME